MTKRMKQILQGLLDRYHEEGAMSIRPEDSIAACVRHEDEKTHVIRGFEKHWPTQLDVKELRKRARSEKHWSKLLKRIEEPESSAWFVALRKKVAKDGRRALSVAAQMSDMSEQRAGYFGEQGWVELLKMLGVHFTGSGSKVDADHNLGSRAVSKRIEPIPSNIFLHSVLMPELICSLIAEDYERKGGVPATLAQIKTVREESSRFGAALFPADGEGIDADELKSLWKRWKADNAERIEQEQLQQAKEEKLAEQKRKHRDAQMEQYNAKIKKARSDGAESISSSSSRGEIELTPPPEYKPPPRKAEIKKSPSKPLPPPSWATASMSKSSQGPTSSGTTSSSRSSGNDVAKLIDSLIRPK